MESIHQTYHETSGENNTNSTYAALVKKQSEVSSIKFSTSIKNTVVMKILESSIPKRPDVFFIDLTKDEYTIFLFSLDEAKEINNLLLNASKSSNNYFLLLEDSISSSFYIDQYYIFDQQQGKLFTLTKFNEENNDIIRQAKIDKIYNSIKDSKIGKYLERNIFNLFD